jgi:hypothetical protein
MADELMLGLGESITTGRAALDGRGALGVPEIVAHFESLGGHALVEGHSPHGCEFGFIRRESGFEPLGLLRWASMKPRNLIAALNDDFRDLANPEQLKLVNRGGYDWGYEHTKSGLRNGHTNLPLAQVTETDGIRLLRKTLPFWHTN